MTKRLIFSLPVFSLGKSTRTLTTLIVILCLAIGMFMSTPLTYAQSPIVVNFMSLGSAKSATVLFSEQKQPSQCVTTGNSNITGSIAENGMFSVAFFSSLDCSGNPNMPLFQFNALPASMSGTVTCQSDTNCVLSSQSSSVSMLSPQSSTVSMLSPQSSNVSRAPILRAEFVNLGSAKSAALNFGGRLIGGCVKQSKSVVEGTVEDKPILFSVNFFPTADCSGSRKISSFRFLLLQGRGGGTLTCRSERDIYAPSGMLRILP